MTEKKYNPKAIAKTIDVEELYDLDVTIARFILPRLMVFKKHCERTPRMNMSKEEWNKALDKMIYAFERIAMQNEEDTPEYKVQSLHQGHLEQRGRPCRPQARRQGLAQAHQRRPVALPQVLPQPVVVNHFFR